MSGDKELRHWVRRDTLEWRGYKWTRRAALSTMLYTFLTTLLLAAGLYSAFKAREAVEAANQAAAAAIRQARIAEDGEKRQLRAYLGYQELRTDRIKTRTTATWSTVQKWKNFGVTPARNLVLYNGFGYAGTGEPVPVPDFMKTKTGLGTAVPPNTEVLSTVPLIDDKIIEEVRENKTVLRIYGAATYEDVFGEKHINQLCLVVKLSTTNENKFNDPKTDLVYCDDYNCADDECEHKTRFVLPTN